MSRLTGPLQSYLWAIMYTVWADKIYCARNLKLPR